MINRTRSFPILGAALLLVVQPHASAQTSTSQVQSEIANPVTIISETTPVTPAAPSVSSPAAATATAPTAPVAAPPAHTANYTVLKGDTLTSLANKFNTTRKKLKELNSLADSKIAPGQVLLVPSYKKSEKSTAVAATDKTKSHHVYVKAQPVQDFDIPASTFASCPVPPTDADADADTTTTTADGKPAPVAQLVSPAELAADQTAAQKAAAKAAQKIAVDKAVASAVPAAAAPALVATTAPISNPSMRHFASTTPTLRLAPAPSGLANPAAAPQTTNHGGLLSFFHPNATTSTPSSEWGNRFLQQARTLGDQGIGYDEEWRPPGESRSWEMDCSNTSRYLYKATANIQLPRTASDQYYYLHLQGKAWDVPLNNYGLVDTEYLRRNLKPGDLLFWENTYKPERQPPITHVMVFLGTNAQGQWIMAGSQGSRGGEHNRRNGGPDIYVFRPSAPCGGYTSWFVHHKGRFCAFGRPLEADPSKFALND